MSDAGERPFRFGVTMTVPGSRTAWAEKCRKAEELGYDVIGVADHLGMAPPFPALVLAAEVTERVRLATFVLNAGFWNPALLARDAAGTDQFTGGRLELGLGVGYVKAEFDDAGIPWTAAGDRVDTLGHTIKKLKRLFADPEHEPAPVQAAGPPLLIAGLGDRVLTLAAEHADIIGFTGTRRTDTRTLIPVDSATIGERVEFVRDKLGGREVELNLPPRYVDVTGDRQAGLEKVRERIKGELTIEQLADVPTVLVGTPEQIAEQLVAMRARFGFSYVSVLERHAARLAPVLELVRGR
ncbi:TIGR03621 family F420-dependent LLM class oxidoreductase [Amycolatopsis sp. NPDC059019]|uniref:TIGR03621 family F420-dependent LLM class oxidoreductase n=2 Tax=Amycolatopsis TaxID=1813 RepID=UPI00366AEE4E